MRTVKVRIAVAAGPGGEGDWEYIGPAETKLDEKRALRSVSRGYRLSFLIADVPAPHSEEPQELTATVVPAVRP